MNRKVLELNSHNSVPRKGISWRAIFAGVVCTVSIAFLLNLLGISFGFGTIEPSEENNPLSGLGTASLVWWAIANLVALFVGSFVAARVGVSFYHKSGIVQGIMTWALYTFLSAWLVTSAVGGIISGVGSTIGSVLSWDDDQQQTGQLDEQQTNQLNLSLENTKEKIYSLLEDSQKPALDPDNLENKADSVMQNSRQQAQEMTRRPGQVDAEIEQIFSNAKNQFENTWEALDQEALVNVLTERTNISQSEARSTVDNYVAEYENLRAKSEEFLVNMKEQAKETAGKISDAMGDAALYLFIALLLGAIVAAAGGAAGVKSLRKDYINTQYFKSSGYSESGPSHQQMSDREFQDRRDPQ